MVVQIDFFNSPQNFSTRECAHRNDTQKICIFSPLHKDLSSTYTVIMMRMLLSIRIRKITEMTLRKFVYLALTQRPFAKANCSGIDSGIFCP
jgi:hypothetical protein